MKGKIICPILMFLVVFDISSQTFEEYQKQEQDKMQQFAQKEKEGLIKLQNEYAEYVAKRDKEWTEFLQKEWENYSVFTGKKLPDKPKPKTNPVYTPPSKPSDSPIAGPVDVPKKNPEVSPKTEPTIKPVEKPVAVVPEPIPQPVDPIRKPAEDAGNAQTSSLRFYGRTFTIPYDPGLEQCELAAVSQDAIGNFWEKTSKTNYTLTVEKLLQAKADLNINDYGYFQLVQQFSRNLFPMKENSARLMNWFIMVRSGYGVRLAFQDNEVALLIPSLQPIYQNSYLTVGGVNYYIFPKLEGEKYFTYDKDYQSAGRPFDFNINSPINFNGRKAQRSLSFNFDDKPNNINIAYDPDLIEFYKNYPLVDLSVYFNAAVSVQSKESMAEALKPLVAGMDEVKAVNLILHFVQTAFEYKTDPEQFGREKFFFAEELFYYPYCDCEDRSVLFSYLVREVLGLKVVGLEYPEHVATAVAFTSPQTGDFLVYNNNRYVVADPTYINAPVGLTMPQYKSVSPVICDVNCHTSEELTADKIWQTAQNAGCYKGSSRKNTKMLPDGGVLLTGYFGNPTQLGGSSLVGAPNTHNCFVAKINRSGQTVWAKALTANGNAVGLSVETTPSGNVVIAGVFTGTLRFAGKSISAKEGSAELFIACFSPSGSMLWLNRGGLDALPQSAATAFSVRFDANGVKQETKHAEVQIEERSQGLFVDDNGGIFYSGMTNNALALAGNDKPVAFASSASLDVISLLQNESEKFIAQQADHAIAGLLAAIRLVKHMGVSLTGVQTQQALDRHNPNFKRTCPNIFRSLGKINFVQNNKGVITIQTDGGKDISFDKVKISNNSTISISDLQGGDVKVDVLSGIKVGKMVVWYNLNYIKMYSKNGNLLFDYSSDHSQASVNVRKDILN